MSELITPFHSQRVYLKDLYLIVNVLNKLSLDTLKSLKLVNKYHNKLIDNFLLNFFNLKTNKKLNFKHLDNLPIIAFCELRLKYHRLINIIPTVVKRNCVQICKWLCYDYINAKVISNEASINGNLEIIKYVYNKYKIVPESSIVRRTFLSNKIEVMSWLLELNILPNAMTAELACDQGNLNLVLLLAYHNILPTNHGADNAIRNNHFEIVKFLYSKGITPRVTALNSSTSHGNLEMTSWLWERNIKISHYGLNNSILHGHLNILKFVYKQGVCFKQLLIDFFEENENGNDEENKIIHWLKNRQDRVLLLQRDINRICKELYYRRDEDIKLIDEKYMKIANWCEKHLNIIPQEETFEYICGKGSLDVIKYLLSKIPTLNNFYFSGAIINNRMDIITYLYEEHKIIPNILYVDDAIKHDCIEMSDYILNLNCDSFIKGFNFDLLLQNILTKSFLMNDTPVNTMLENIIRHPISKKIRKDYLSKKSTLRGNSSLENDNILEDDDMKDDNILKKISSLKDNHILMKELTQLVREQWYMEYLPSGESINFAITYGYLNCVKWLFKRKFVFNQIFVNSSVCKMGFPVLRFFVDNHIYPDIFLSISNILHNNLIDVLKFLIERNVIDLSQRQPFTRNHILDALNRAAEGGYLDLLKYLYNLTILDRDGNRINMLPGNHGLYRALDNHKYDTAVWILDKVFMMIEIEKLFTGKLSINGKSRSFFVNQNGINSMIRHGHLKLLEKCINVKFVDDEDNETSFTFHIVYAFQFRQIRSLKWLNKRNIYPTVEDLNSVARNGLIEILKYYANELDGKYSRTDVIILPNQNGANDVCSYGYIEILKWLCNKGIFPNQVGVNHAISHGYVNVVQFLYQINILPDRELIDRNLLQSFPQMEMWLKEKGFIE